MAGVQPGFIRFGGRDVPINSAIAREPKDQRYKQMSVTQALSDGSSRPSMILDASGNPYQNRVIPAKTGGAIGRASEGSKVGYNKRNGYPFIDWRDLGKNWYKIPWHWGLLKMFSFYDVAPENRESLGSKAIGALCDFQVKQHQQQLYAIYNDVFPKIMVWKDFAKSPSTVSEIYTVEWGNKELPVYMRKENGPEATDERISEGIRFVVNKKSVNDLFQSPYNTNESPHIITDFWRDGFARLAADKFTRGDYETFIDPGRFNPWFIRDDSWYIQNYGKSITTKTVQVDGNSYTVKGYKRPGKASMWWYWFVGDVVYDAIDAFFDPIQKTAERLFSTEAQQAFVRSEYKMIAGIRRSIFDNGGRLDLAYETPYKPSIIQLPSPSQQQTAQAA